MGLTGDWELEHPTPRFDRLVDDHAPGHPVHAVEFDTTDLGEWDSSLLTFLVQARDYCEVHDLELKEEALPKEIAFLLELARAAPEQDVDGEEGTVYGLILGLSGCMKGMQTGDHAGAVGRAATSAVVMGITLIITANAVIDWLAVLLEI